MSVNYLAAFQAKPTASKTHHQHDASPQSTLLSLVPPHGRIESREPSKKLRAIVNRIIKVQRNNSYTTAMGNSWQVLGESGELERIGTPKDGRTIETVCEIGFNAGHSASALLLHNNATLHEVSGRHGIGSMMNTHTRLLTCVFQSRLLCRYRFLQFDVMALKWSNACLEEVRALFPGRVVLHKGDSKRTGPAFASRVSLGLQRPCDIFFIDGHHSNPHVVYDFYTAINATRPGGIIMADDTSALFKTVLKLWHFHTARGDIVQPRCAFPVRRQSIGLRSFCVGVRAPDGRRYSGRQDWSREDPRDRVNGSWARWYAAYDPKSAWAIHVDQLRNTSMLF